MIGEACKAVRVVQAHGYVQVEQRRVPALLRWSVFAGRHRSSDNSTCVRVDPNDSAALAWVVGFVIARVVLQSVEFAQVEPVVFVSMIDEPRFAVRRLEGSVFSSHLTLPNH